MINNRIRKIQEEINGLVEKLGQISTELVTREVVPEFQLAKKIYREGYRFHQSRINEQDLDLSPCLFKAENDFDFLYLLKSPIFIGVDEQDFINFFENVGFSDGLNHEVFKYLKDLTEED